MGETTMTVTEAYATVFEGRSYQREHFPMGHPGKFVGHVPSEKYDEALDVLLAVLPSLIEAYAPHVSDGSQGGAMTAEFVPTWERPVTTWTDAELRGVGCAAHEDYVSEEILRSDVRRLVAEVQRLRQVVSEFDGCDAPPPGRSHVRCDWEKGHVGAHMWVQRIDGPDA